MMVLISSFGFSQVINVSTTTYTVPQLVQDVLFGTGVGSGACAGTISNITWSTGSNFGSTNGIGYFQNTNPSFHGHLVYLKKISSFYHQWIK